METTYNIEVRLEQGENDEGEPVVRVVRTGENEFIIDVYDGKVWLGYSFRLDEQISIDAKNLWSYDGY